MQVPIVAISAAHDYKMNWSQDPIMWSWHLSLPLLLHDVFFFFFFKFFTNRQLQIITEIYNSLQLSLIA